MKKILVITASLAIACAVTGCTDGWKMDYGKPAAQFLQEDVASKGTAFVGKKIVVKGTVAKVDVTEMNAAKIYLQAGVQCNLGVFKEAAESYKSGDTIVMAGILQRCEEGNILLDPAFPRDPTASFNPM